VIALIEAQAAKIPQAIDALLLVGGFSGCEYLFKKVDVSLFPFFSLRAIVGLLRSFPFLPSLPFVPLARHIMDNPSSTPFP
jgi:hypothetical protein